MFKVAGIRRDVRDDKSNQDGPSAQCLLIEKLAAPVLELANRGLAQGATGAVGEVEAPLVGLGIVEAKGQGFEAACRAGDLELQEVGAAVPDFVNDRSALIFDPGRGAGQGIQEALYARFPSTNLEVEIVLPISSGIYF